MLGGRQMSEKERIDTDDLASTLRGLKNLSKNDYKKALYELHYDGPSFKTPKQFDAFLLKVVYEHFDTVDTDYILISLGLLLGYEREIGIGKRYEKYLRDSSYIQDVYSGGCKEPYDSVDGKQKNRYKAALRDLADGRIEKLAEVIAEIKKQKDFEEYIKAALTDYYDESNNTVRLKRPYYATIKLEDTISKSAKQKKKNSSKKLHFEFVHKISVTPLTAATVFMFLLMVAIHTYNGKTSEKEISTAIEDSKKIVPNKIEIKYKNIQLPLGGDCYLSVKTEPSELNPNDLFYVSSDRDVAYVENIHSNHVIAVENLKNSAKNYSDIVVTNINGSAQDTATVTVEGAIQSKSELDGKNNDDTVPDDFQGNID